MRARKIPVTIDFFEIKEDDMTVACLFDIAAWVTSCGDEFYDHFDIEDGQTLRVKTLEGTSYPITSSDMILRGVNGEYYPCKKDIFEKTYEVLSNEIEYFRNRC